MWYCIVCIDRSSPVPNIPVKDSDTVPKLKIMWYGIVFIDRSSPVPNIPIKDADTVVLEELVAVMNQGTGRLLSPQHAGKYAPMP